MKKSMTLLSLALAFGAMGQVSAQTAVAASALQAPALQDVPAGHWAKDAIDTLVSKGVLLGYPDGTFRGTQNLSRYEAAVIIARVLEQQRSGQVSLDSETMTLVQNAISELAADLVALGVRVSDLESRAVNKDDFARLEERVASLDLSGEAESIASLQQQIDTLTMDVADYETLRVDVEANTAQIAALNDLTVLLNSDIMGIQERLDTVDDRFVTFDGRVNAIDNRVTALEGRQQVTIGLESFGVDYTNRNVTGAPFDVDRLTQGTVFAGRHGDDDVRTVEDTKIDTDNSIGFVTIGIKNNVLNQDAKFQVSEANLNLGLNAATVLSGRGDVAPAVLLEGANVKGTVEGRPFTAQYAWNAQSVKFNKYFFDQDMDRDLGVNGIANSAVLRVDGEGRVPAVTAVLGNDARPGSVLGTTFGIRTAWTMDNAQAGVSYARWADRQGASVDANATFGNLSASAVYAASLANGQDFDARAQAGDVRLNYKGDFGVLPFAAGAYFQAVTPNWGALESGSHDQDADVRADTVRYGVSAQTTVGVPFGLGMTVGGYVDRETNYFGPDRWSTSYGASAGLNVAGLDLVGFYNTTDSQRTIDGSTTTTLNHVIDAEGGVGAKAPLSDVSAPYSRGNNFGVALLHRDGALVDGLNAGVAYARLTDIDTSDVTAYGSYEAKVGPVTLEPFARFRNYDAADSGFVGFQNIKAGARLETEAGVLPLNARLGASGVMRHQTYSDAGPSTTESLVRVGLGFDHFLGQEDLSFGVGYANYAARGVESTTVGMVNGGAFDATRDQVYAGGTNVASSYRMINPARGAEANLSGVYAQANWKGLQLDYGRFVNTALGADSVNNTFRASYTFKF